MGGSPTDNNAILVRQGQDQILDPLEAEGKIEVVADQWVENWDAAKAVTLMENMLASVGNDVDAVVASNDGTALGALQALSVLKDWPELFRFPVRTRQQMAATALSKANCQ